GGVSVAHLARWNGSAWSDVRVGTDGPVYALAGFHNEVQVGGGFSNVGIGIASPGWARYLETGAPWIAAQPLSAFPGCGGDAVFDVTPADGYSLSGLSWRRNGTPLANGSTGTGSFVQGAGTTELTLQNVGLFDQADYTVVISNACGSATSSAATLTASGCCESADFNCDGDLGTDADIEAF